MILNEVLERLKKFDFNDAFYKRELDRIAEDLDSIEQPAEAIDAIFEFIENHSDEDLGLPGPLVRFVEQFIGKEYEDKLVASLRRRPNSYNIWMLNRLLNYLDTESRAYYVGLMEELERHRPRPVANRRSRSFGDDLRVWTEVDLRCLVCAFDLLDGYLMGT